MSTPAATRILDSRWSRALSTIAIIAMVIVAAAAFALSYQALADVSVRFGVLPWVLPVFLDGGILALGLFRAKLRMERRSTWGAVWLLIAATIASSAANFMVHHVESGDAMVIVVTAVISPIFFLGLTEMLIYSVVPTSTPTRKPRKRTQIAAADPAVAPAPAVAAPALKPAPKRATRPASAAVPLDSLSPEVAAMVDEFRAVAHDPASSEGGAVSDRMSELLLTLVDDHDVRAVDLSRVAGHADAARIRARLKKARDQQKNLVSV